MPAKLYGANVSPFVRKVRVYMAEKGLDYDYEQVSPMAPPEGYRKISPLGKIPAFTDGDKTLADSSVICAYLERLHPTPAMYPADAYDYARTLWIEEFIDSGFTPKAGPEVFRPLVLGPLMMKQPVTPEIRASVDQAIAEGLTPMWQYLEDELGNNEFFVGGQLTLADISVASVHVNLWHAAVDVDAAKFPHLAAFIERMFARPSFKAMLEEEAPRWSRRDAA